MISGQERQQSLGEEIANSLSHGLALLATLIAAPFLIVSAVRHGDTLNIIGASVFSVTMVVLYGTSMLYHALPSVRALRAKQVFQILDHSAIYLLIADTYTPFTLGVLRGPWGWTATRPFWWCATASCCAFTPSSPATRPKCTWCCWTSLTSPKSLRCCGVSGKIRKVFAQKNQPRHYRTSR